MNQGKSLITKTTRKAPAKKVPPKATKPQASSVSTLGTTRKSKATIKTSAKRTAVKKATAKKVAPSPVIKPAVKRVASVAKSKTSTPKVSVGDTRVENGMVVIDPKNDALESMPPSEGLVVKTEGGVAISQLLPTEETLPSKPSDVVVATGRTVHPRT